MKEIGKKYYENINYDYLEEYFEMKVILSSGNDNE